MRVVVYQSLADMPQDIARRISYPSQREFFLSSDWYRNLHNTALSTTLKLRIYVAMNQAEPVGALFCGELEGKRKLHSLTSFYSLEYAPIFLSDSGSAESIIHLIVKFIATEKPRWRVVDLRLLKTDSPAYSCLADSLNKCGFVVNPYFQYENWHYFLNDGESFSSYYDGRPSRLKNTIARKERKLTKKYDVEIKIFREDDSNLQSAIRDYVAVYNKSWKRPEPFMAFTPSLVEMCAKLGVLRLGLLYLDGRPAAAQLWITTEHKATIYKLSYDEKYRDLSVGSILSRELFKIAIDTDGANEIDYGIGSEKYKKDWMNSVREIGGIEAFNTKTVLGLWLAVVQRMKNFLKARLQPAER